MARGFTMNFRLLFLLFPVLSCSVRAEDPVWPNVAVAMEKQVAAGEVPGVVTLVAGPDGTLHHHATGKTSPDGPPMAKDNLFWIASITKPITGTAVMMLAEEGKLSIDDPVSRYLPEFGDLKDADGKPVVVTIGQCLDHTSGLAEVPREEGFAFTGLAEFTPRVVAQPVLYPPGRRWRYCQSGINTAARVVEVVSGKSFPMFLEERLFTPLGMKDTTFYPAGERLARVVPPTAKGPAGLQVVPNRLLGGRPLDDTTRVPMANGGLFSTASDLGRFARMILRGGELDGRRYLKEDSVKAMLAIRTGDLPAGFVPGTAWGLGWCVIREPAGAGAGLSPGTHGHGGAYGTQLWIDPVKRLAHVLMIQRADIGNSDGSGVREAFHKAAAAR